MVSPMRPKQVAANVRLAIDTGVAGISIEDWSGSAMYDTEPCGRTPGGRPRGDRLRSTRT